MLDFVEVNDVCTGYFVIYISQKVSSRISQAAHNLPAGPSRLLFLVTYPASTQNPRSARKEISIAQIDCHIGIVRVFVAHKHP
jgi:hypothetical protein